MRKPEHPIELFLQPGEVFFAGANTRIRTLLGSCVSLVCWHPKLVIGGMCHFMMPSRNNDGRKPLDGRYAEDAFQMMINNMRDVDTHTGEYRVKLFGGANMFAEKSLTVSDVGKQNVFVARKLIKQYGFICDHEDVEGTVYRNIIFDIWDGVVRVKRGVNKGSL